MILVVEDNVRIASFLADLLRDSGRDVRVAHSADQAAAELTAIRTVELLACDLALAGDSGWDVAALARRLHPGVEVLIMSGTAIQNDGAHFILKPFDAGAFLAKVDLLLAQRRAGAPVGGC